MGIIREVVGVTVVAWLHKETKGVIHRDHRGDPRLTWRDLGVPQGYLSRLKV